MTHQDTSPKKRRPVNRRRIDDFPRAYIRQALKDFPLQNLYDIEEETLVRMLDDCVKFYWQNRITFEAIWADESEEYDLKKAGRDFWDSRNIHDHSRKVGFEKRDSLFSPHRWTFLHVESKRWRKFPLVYDKESGEIKVDRMVCPL